MIPPRHSGNKKADQKSDRQIFENGAPTGTRTQDPMIKSHLLYQLSYGRSIRNKPDERNIPFLPENANEVLKKY